MWNWFALHAGVDDQGLDPDAPVFRTETTCPNPWPSLIVAFAIGAIVVYALKK